MSLPDTARSGSRREPQRLSSQVAPQHRTWGLSEHMMRKGPGQSASVLSFHQQCCAAIPVWGRTPAGTSQTAICVQCNSRGRAGKSIFPCPGHSSGCPLTSTPGQSTSFWIAQTPSVQREAEVFHVPGQKY